MSTLFAKTRTGELSPLSAEDVDAVTDGHHGVAQQLASPNGEPHDLGRQHEPSAAPARLGYTASLYEQTEHKELFMSNEGKKVKVHYVGTLDDGTKFDSSRDRNEPLEFTCMAGQMIRGFDAAVKDMEVGQVPAAEAYGERRDDLMQTVPVSMLPGAENLSAGDKVMLASPSGQPFPATVAKVEDGSITFDMNHEMAGKDLNFNIELLEIAE